MIDIHSHLIPNIDDGSTSFPLSISIIEKAAKNGVTDLIVTPHFIYESKYDANNAIKKKLFNNLVKEVKENNIDINLYLGNEIYIYDDIVKLIATGNAMPLADSKYVLFEIPMNSNYLGLREVVIDLEKHGFIPVLAHPERYQIIKDDPTLIYEIFDMGVLLQSNIGSLFGDYGKTAQALVELFLKHDLITFLGTDSHRGATVYERLPLAESKLIKLVGKGKTKDLLVNNAKHIISKRMLVRHGYTEFKKNIFGKYK